MYQFHMKMLARKHTQMMVKCAAAREACDQAEADMGRAIKVYKDRDREYDVVLAEQSSAWREYVKYVDAHVNWKVRCRRFWKPRRRRRQRFCSTLTSCIEQSIIPNTFIAGSPGTFLRVHRAVALNPIKRKK